MIKVNKIMILPLLAAAFTFGACSDDDSWSAGEPTNAEGINVYIPTGDGADVTLSPTDNSFNVTIARSDANGELTVPLATANANGYDKDGNAIFTVPQTVTFADGEKEKTITVACADGMEMFKTYNITISIPESYTKPYADSEESLPRKELNIIKEDYAAFATGTYYSEFWGDDDGNPAEEQTSIEYSEIKDMYRVKNVMSGQTFTFSVDENNKISFDDSKYSTGYVDSSYGNVYISPSENEEYGSYYNLDTKTFYFGWEYTVSAGSFGDYYEWFTVTE